MPNLETKILEWREQMIVAGVPVESLDELESHLREEIQGKLRRGEDPRRAFEAAVQEVGQPAVLKDEFAKVGVPALERLKNVVFTLAGIPGHQFATNMNTPFEPRWASYLKTGAVMLPAMFFWMGACVFIMPKLKEICIVSAVPLPPWIVTAMNVSAAVQNNFILGSLVIITLLVVLEWRSQRWARYRRLVFGIAGFALNLTVLVFIAVIGVLATVAAAQLLSHMPAAH